MMRRARKRTTEIEACARSRAKVQRLIETGTVELCSTDYVFERAGLDVPARLLVA